MSTEFCDCVYQVERTYTLEKNVIGVGNTTVRRIFTNVGAFSTTSFGTFQGTYDSTTETFDTQSFVVYQGGISSSFNFGKFSWGKIIFNTRSSKDFDSYNLNGYSGISTSSLLQRTNPLKSDNYV
jgi:hypothetical protein